MRQRRVCDALDGAPPARVSLRLCRHSDSAHREGSCRSWWPKSAALRPPRLSMRERGHSLAAHASEEPCGRCKERSRRPNAFTQLWQRPVVHPFVCARRRQEHSAPHHDGKNTRSTTYSPGSAAARCSSTSRQVFYEGKQQIACCWRSRTYGAALLGAAKGRPPRAEDLLLRR